MNLAAVYVVEVFAITALIIGMLVDSVPWLSLLALATLIPLSLYTFAKPTVPARVVGWTLMALGLVIVLCKVVGLRVG